MIHWSQIDLWEYRVGKCLTGSICLSLMESTTVKIERSECACEDSAEAQNSKNPLGIRKWKLRRNNVEEHVCSKAQDTWVHRREGRQRSTAIGSHSKILSAVRSDRSCMRFTIGKSQGEIPTERGPSDLNIDKKSMLKRRTGLRR